MELFSFIIILAAAFIISLWVSRPFNHSQVEAGKKDKNNLFIAAALEGEHQRLLDALQELDFDHAQGKLIEEDYAAQRLGLLQAGAAVLKQMDEEK